MHLHRIPLTIVSDRDKIFLSKFWRELFRLQGTALQFSTAYHPQSDGQTEVLNRCLETYLCCFAHRKPKSWAHYLSWAEFWYNTSFHTVAKTTPFRIVYGWDPPSFLTYEAGSFIFLVVDQQLLNRDAILAKLRQHLHCAQQRMKAQADGKQREVSFQVGDLVFLKLRPYHQKTMAHRSNPKLSLRFYGPFRISDKVGPVAYSLQLPNTSQIHPVFHVSLLKPAVGYSAPLLQLPPLLNDNMEIIVELETVLGTRHISKWTGSPH